MQRCVFLGVTVKQVGVCPEQQLDYFQPTIKRSQVQRCLKLVVPHGGIGEFLQKKLHHLGVTILGSTVQRSLVVIVLLGGQQLGEKQIWTHDANVQKLNGKGENGDGWTCEDEEEEVKQLSIGVDQSVEPGALE